MSPTLHRESPLERLKRLRRETAEKPEPRLVGEVSELRTGEGSKGSKVPQQPTDDSIGVTTDIHLIEVRRPEGIELVATGWTPKERLGKTLWQSPENEFWYSQEIAWQLLENGGRE